MRERLGDDRHARRTICCGPFASAAWGIAFSAVFAGILAGCATTVSHSTDRLAGPAAPLPSAAPASDAASSLPSDVRPSRQAVFFNTLDVPPVATKTQQALPIGFQEHLQTSLIRIMKETRLFSNVMPDAPYQPGGGGVLSVRGTILTWTADETSAWVTIHVALIAKGIGDQFAESTAAGVIKRRTVDDTSAAGNVEAYDLTPLVEGIAAFVTTFMDPL